jgi:uncharacterized protein YbbC (DUF1343 family)
MSKNQMVRAYRRNNIMIFVVIILGCLGTIAGSHFLNKKTLVPFDYGIEQFVSPELNKIKNENTVLVIDKNSYLRDKVFSYDFLSSKLNIVSIVIPPEPNFYYALKQNYPNIEIHYIRSNTNYNEIFNENIDYIIYDIQHIGIRDEQLNTLIFNIMSVINQKATEFIILDRPNPFGHKYINGFEVQAKDLTENKILNVPIFHGLSTAETAREIARTHYFSDINLNYVMMENLQRFREIVNQDVYSNYIGPENLSFNDKFSYIYFQYLKIFGTSLFIDETEQVFANEKINAIKFAHALNGYEINNVSFEAIGVYNYKQELVYGLKIHFKNDFNEIFRVLFEITKLLLNAQIIELTDDVKVKINNFFGSKTFISELEGSANWSDLSKILEAERESYYDKRLAILLY